MGREVDVAGLDHRQDHADQAESLAVFRAEDARYAVAVQVGDFGRHDHAAAAAEYLDVLAAASSQQVDHVLEILDVAALVARHGDALCVFLQRGRHDVVHRAVVAQVDHFGAVGHEDAAHDVDRGVVPVEQRGRRDEAHLVGGFVFGELLGDGKIGHGFLGGVRCLGLFKVADVYVNVKCRWLLEMHVIATAGRRAMTPLSRLRARGVW